MSQQVRPYRNVGRNEPCPYLNVRIEVVMPVRSNSFLEKTNDALWVVVVASTDVIRSETSRWRIENPSL
jgi:hypothetical protein